MEQTMPNRRKPKPNIIDTTVPGYAAAAALARRNEEIRNLIQQQRAEIRHDITTRLADKPNNFRKRLYHK
jgi:hypothetical protein